MRLSAAIRQGSQGRPQAQGTFIDLLTGPVHPVCALGAAVLAEFPDVEPDPQRLAEHSVKWLTSLQWEMSDWDECPVDECEEYPRTSLEDMVVHLNDDHGWTFEQIAAWAETLEVGMANELLGARLTEGEDVKATVLRPVSRGLPRGYGILSVGGLFIPVALDPNGQRRLFPGPEWDVVCFHTEAEARAFIADDFDGWQDEQAGAV